MTPPPATDVVTATAAALLAPPAPSVGRDDGAPPPPVAAFAALARSRGLALPDGRALTFASLAPGGAAAAGAALDWERAIAATACVGLREGSWHDAFNAAAWLAFPRTKAALNAVHVEAGVASARGAPAGTVVATTAAPGANARTRARDAATLLDESGILVACADARIVGAWREHRWRDAFGDAANVGAALAAWVVGHGVLDKLRAPFPALTAKALVLPVAPSALPVDAEARRAVVDRCAAGWIAARGAAFAPADLIPLPLAALPALAWPPLAGRPPMSAEPRRFDDVAVFRPARRGSPAVA